MKELIGFINKEKALVGACLLRVLWNIEHKSTFDGKIEVSKFHSFLCLSEEKSGDPVNSLSNEHHDFLYFIMSPSFPFTFYKCFILFHNLSIIPCKRSQWSENIWNLRIGNLTGWRGGRGGHGIKSELSIPAFHLLSFHILGINKMSREDGTTSSMKK